MDYNLLVIEEVDLSAGETRVVIPEPTNGVTDLLEKFDNHNNWLDDRIEYYSIEWLAKLAPPVLVTEWESRDILGGSVSILQRFRAGEFTYDKIGKKRPKELRRMVRRALVDIEGAKEVNMETLEVLG